MQKMKSRFSQIVAVSAAILCTAAFMPIAQAQSAGPSDPQIVGIVIGANKIDIAYAKIALKKSHNQEVLGFAHQMIKDHTTVLNSVKKLAKQLGVKPAKSSTGTSLGTQAKEERAKLEGLSGEAFNKAYIDNEVAFHKTVINAMKTTLIPDSQNTQLKDALKGAVPLFEGHLAHAENIQKTLQ